MSMVRPLTLDDLRLPDDELGRLFLNICIAAEAENHGLPADSIPEEFSNRMISLFREIEAEHAKHTTVEKVLHKAATGDDSTAGRLLKEHMSAGAENMANANLLIQQVQIRLKGPRAGGAKTKKIKEEENAPRNAKIRSNAESLRKSGVDERLIRSKLADRHSLSKKQIGRILKEK